MPKFFLMTVMMIGLVLAASVAAMSQTVSITSNFNGTTIAPGNYVWINSVFSASGMSTTQPTTLTFSNASVSIAGTTYTLPTSTITFVPGGTTTSTVFTNGMWVTTVPLGTGGNTFLTGLPIQFPVGLPGGTNPVVFTGTFSSNTPGISGNVKFAAAVYPANSVPANLNDLNVKTSDSVGGSDHAGTPEAIKTSVTGGARGGGGSNFTGSYSGTASFTSTCCTMTPTPTPTPTPPMTTPTPPTMVPEPASILLFASGLLGVGGALRKRFRKA